MGFFRIPVKLYTLIFGLLFSMVGVVFFTVYTLNAQKADGNVINLAGKQRMLSQKLSKSVMELQLGDVTKVKEITGIQNEFTKVLQGLRQGSTELNLPPAETQAVTLDIMSCSRVHLEPPTHCRWRGGATAASADDALPLESSR